MPKQREFHIDRDREIGQRLRELRVSRGWTQAALAEQLGVSYQQVHKYEAAVCQIPLYMLIELTRVFGVAFDALIGETDSAGAAPIRNRTALKLMTGFAALQPAQQDALAELVHVLASETGPETETAREAAQ